MRTRDDLKSETGHETGTDLWRVIAAPSIWAVHFLVCYVVGAVYCEKAGRTVTLLPVQWIVGLATAIALALIALVIRSLWKVRGRSIASQDYSFSANVPQERHRFLSHLALMLCVLSIAAIAFVTIPAVIVGTCR